MDIAPTYNGLGDKIRRSITWQFDKAPHLIGIIGIIDSFYKASTETLFNRFLSKTYDLANADSFGLSVWGALIGLPRPTYIAAGNVLTPISDDYYRRLLLAKLYLMSTNYSMPAITQAIKIAYGGRFIAMTGYDQQGNGTIDNTQSGHITYIVKGNESGTGPVVLTEEEKYLTGDRLISDEAEFPNIALWAGAGIIINVYPNKWIPVQEFGDNNTMRG